MKIKRNTLYVFAIVLIVAISVSIYVFAENNTVSDKFIHTPDYVIDNTAAVTAYGTLGGFKNNSEYITDGIAAVGMYSWLSSDLVYAFASVSDNVCDIAVYVRTVDGINPSPSNYIDTGYVTFNHDVGVTSIEGFFQAYPLVLAPSLNTLSDYLTLTLDDFS